MLQVKASVAALILVGAVAGSAIATNIVTKYSLAVSCVSQEQSQVQPRNSLPIGPPVPVGNGEKF